MATVRTAKSKRRSKKTKDFVLFRILPESLQVFLARRLVDITAFSLTGLGLFVLLAMATYTHTDPSWNTATSSKAVENWSGKPGAWTADLLIQTLGIGGAFLAFGVLIWGIRLFRRQRIAPLWARIIALIITGVGTSIAFAQIPSNGWTLHPYLGSSAGTLILNKLENISFLLDSRLVCLLAGGLSFVTFLIASAVTQAELTWAFNKSRAFIVGITLTITDIITGFLDWVKYHNDPGYTPKPFEFLKNFKTPGPDIQRADPRKLPAQKQEASIIEPEHFIPPPAPKQQSSIPVVTPPAAQKPSSPTLSQQTLALSEGDWELPEIGLLQTPPPETQAPALSESSLRKNAELLGNVLSDFGIQGDIVSIHPGPVVTLYELEPAPGTKSSKIINISDDIARSMSAVSVRCAVVPGRNVIGIELPNKQRQTVYMQDLLASRLFEKTKAKLPLILGKDIGGQPILADLAKMPHLLVAGTTGSGKSVAVNSMILSLLFRLPPEKCRFIMIDPKMLELSVYDGIPHLLSPVVTDPGKAIVSLKWAVQEMENRYRSMSKLGVRNLEGYNARVREAAKNNEKIMTKVQTGFDPGTGQATYEEQEMDLTELPYIVVIVDEFADLMLVAGKDVESAIQRLAQMARAAGIHLIMATQRPSVDVITGVIKANFPTRISFSVTSKIDSRTILGEGGAEQLLGMGDMLYMAPGGRITRVHGPFVSDDDVEKVVRFLKMQGEPQYLTDVTDGDGFDDSEIMVAMFGETKTEDAVDELYDRAVAVVAREGKASTSFIQRHLQIGYNRAARIVEEMEKQGIISPASPTGKREVLIRDFSDV